MNSCPQADSDAASRNGDSADKPNSFTSLSSLTPWSVDKGLLITLIRQCVSENALVDLRYSDDSAPSTREEGFDLQAYYTRLCAVAAGEVAASLTASSLTAAGADDPPRPTRTSSPVPLELNEASASAIDKDVGRTGFDLDDSIPGGEDVIRRLLTAYALHNRSITYCQGMHFIAAFLACILFPPSHRGSDGEECNLAGGRGDADDATPRKGAKCDWESFLFGAFALVIEKFFPGHHDPDTTGVRVEHLVLKSVLEHRFPSLSAHLDSIGFDLQLVTTQWFISSFLHVLPLPVVTLVWQLMFDVALSQVTQHGNIPNDFHGSRDILLGVCAAVFKCLNEKLSDAATVRDSADAMQELQLFCRMGICDDAAQVEEGDEEANGSNLRITALKFWGTVQRECESLGIAIPDDQKDAVRATLTGSDPPIPLDLRSIRKTHSQNILSEIEASEMELWSGTIVQFHGRATLGLSLREETHGEGGGVSVVVSRFKPNGKTGGIGQAEASGKISIGDVLTAVNGEEVLTLKSAVKMITTARQMDSDQPLLLSFSRAHRLDRYGSQTSQSRSRLPEEGFTSDGFSVDDAVLSGESVCLGIDVGHVELLLPRPRATSGSKQKYLRRSGSLHVTSYRVLFHILETQPQTHGTSLACEHSGYEYEDVHVPLMCVSRILVQAPQDMGLFTTLVTLQCKHLRTIHLLFTVPNEADGFVRLVKGLAFSPRRDVRIAYAFSNSGNAATAPENDMNKGDMRDVSKGSHDTDSPVGRTKRLITDASIDVDAPNCLGVMPTEFADVDVPAEKSEPSVRESLYRVCRKLPPQCPADAGHSGWNVYDVFAEFSRLGFLSMPGIRVVWQSKEYEVCSTYPRALVFPRDSDISEIKKCAAFRSKSRLPVACWVHPRTKAILGRCAQPLPGLRNTRSKRDESHVLRLMAAGRASPRSKSPRSRRPQSRSPHSNGDGNADGKEKLPKFPPLADEAGLLAREAANSTSPTSFAAGVWNSINTWASSSGLVTKSGAKRSASDGSPGSDAGIRRSVSGDPLRSEDRGAGSDTGDDAVQGAPEFYILDARSQIAAMANRAIGKGTENIDNYAGAKLQFMSISNIHSVRSSFNKLADLARPGSVTEDDDNFERALADCGWLSNVKAVLRASIKIARMLENEGKSVLTHCSDGWDRTSQMVSIAMLLLDPHYRTRRGFGLLVEKEWCSFGHKFLDRCGHVSAKHDDNEISPIFVLWIDCVYQIVTQFPNAFEFNEHFLIAVLDHLYSGRFGTFLTNNEQQRGALGLRERTPSVWTYVASPHTHEMFVNPMYASLPKTLFPSCHPKRIRLWTGYYFRFDPVMSEGSREPMPTWI